MERPSDEDWDSWFIESIRRYTDLHMFDLQQPCRVLVWTERQSLCLASCHTAQHNDILELQLPSKLLQLSSQEMCPERDFKVIHGGFSERPIHCLKYIPEHRLLVSSGPPDNSLQVWKIGVEDTDLIKMQQRISNEDHDNHWSRADVSSSNATDVLHGSCSKNITVSDIGTGQASYRAGSKHGNTSLADLTFLDRHSFLTCTSNGHLYRLDTRVPPESLEPADSSTTDLKDAVRGVAVSATQVARLSASGTFHLFDLRELQSPVGTADAMPSTPALESDLCVAWAPHLPGYIAMSGFESIVQIYDTSTWNSIPRQALPVFTHEGHAPGKTRPQHPRVSALAWHPLKARTVFSADEYGTLQAWNWVPD